MKTNKDILFPYYSGNIYKSDALGSVNLDYMINAIKNPKPQIKKLFQQIKFATKQNDVQKKRELKQQLFSFTPSVIISKGCRRNYDNVSEFTGLMQLDFDCIETVDEAIKIKEHIFFNYKQIICAFLSPSGKGVKCLMRIEKPKDIHHYKALHKGMESTFEEYNYLDTATKNAVLPMFLSYDKNIKYRNFFECEEWNVADYTKTNYVRLNDEPTQTSFSLENKSDYFDKVVRIITERFNSILDNGHPQVRATSLILGSRVAAGYISESDARYLAEFLIRQNSYLQKGLKGYLNTASWAIGQGMNVPKYF